jgi:hypothetical protein
MTGHGGAWSESKTRLRIRSWGWGLSGLVDVARNEMPPGQLAPRSTSGSSFRCAGLSHRNSQ